MRLAADAGGEVDEPAVGRPARVARLEIPVRGEVDRLAAGDRPDVQIARPAVIQLLLDDHVGAERARVRQVLAVRREVDVAVDVAVVGEPRDLAVGRDRPEVGLVVLQLVAPVGIGGEREQLAVRMPGDVRPAAGPCRRATSRLAAAGAAAARSAAPAARAGSAPGTAAPSRWKSFQGRRLIGSATSGDGESYATLSSAPASGSANLSSC